MDLVLLHKERTVRRREKEVKWVHHDARGSKLSTRFPIIITLLQTRLYV